MLKRMSIRKISVATLALFSLLLLYLMPSNQELEYTLSDKVEYEYSNSNTIVYLMDSNDYIARTTIPGKEKDPVKQAQNAIKTLIIDTSKAEEVPNGFRGIIPAGTEIKEISLDNQTLVVNFSKELLDINEKYEEKMIESIVYTTTSVEGINNILIKVEGNDLKELPKSKKTLAMPLDKKYGINKNYEITTTRDIDSYTVYYVSSYNDSEYYVPVTKYINKQNKDKVKIIINELSASPIHETNLMSYLNANTSLINYEQDGDTFNLNFNDAILENKSSNKILEEVIYTISLSLNDNYNVKEVNFLVNNKEICKNLTKTLEQ